MDITCDIQEKADMIYEEPDLSEILQIIHDTTVEVRMTSNEDLDNSLDAWVAQKLDYMDNYSKKALCKIAEYYQVPTKRYSKSDIATAIVQYEFDIVNSVTVEDRRRSWKAIQTLRDDPRMKKYVMLDVV
jgi:hypothetical protein